MTTHFTPYRNSLLATLPSLFLFTLAHSTFGQGSFDVTVNTEETVYCFGDNMVGYVLTVDDPTYPIVINWSGQSAVAANDEDEYEQHRYRTVSGSGWMDQQGATVTNGNGQVKSDWAQPYVIEPPGFWEFYAEHYPYAPGGQIHGTAVMSETYSIWFDAPGYTWLSPPCPFGTPATCYGDWRVNNVPPGTVIYASGNNGCGGDWDMPLTIGPPCVLPAIQFVDVEGSCSNAPTGQITVAVAAVAGQWSACSTARLQRRNATTGSGWSSLGPNVNAGALATLAQVPAGSWWVRAYAGPYVVGDSILVEVPSVGGTCGRAVGRAWLDENTNCSFNFNETPLVNAVIEVLPGPVYTSTWGGGWTTSLVLGTGSYTATMSHPQAQAICGADPLSFNITGATQVTNVQFPAEATTPMDLRLAMTSGTARPGFEYRVNFFTENLGPLPTGAWTLTAEFEPVLQFVSGLPSDGLSVQGNTLTWQLPSMNAYGARSINAYFQVPADVGLLGSTVTVSALAETTNADGDLSNNSASVQRTITGAYDPNDKLARTSSGGIAQWIPGQDQWVDYTIRFQNTGSDTAFNVLIIDTLPPQLDPASLDVLGASHPFQWMIKGSGILKFAFPGILLPDSNVNEPLSHSLVSFRIRMRDGFMTEPGDEVVNIANIYFDFNPPIITEPCVLTVPYPGEQVLLDAQVFLSGVYNTGSGLMRDDLRAQGLLPTSEPYSALGYSFQGGGGEQVLPAVLAQTGPTAIVDWVVVELRPAVAPDVVAYSRAALLRRDGRVVDVDGTSPVAITAVSSSYLVGLQHRNHLPVLFDLDLFFQPAESEDATAVDFTDPAAQVFGVEAQQGMGGVMALWPGDVDFNGIVKYTGADNDRDAVLIAVGGNPPTNVVNGVYSGADVNMDGDVRYTGTGNDRDIILQAIGGTVPTAVRTEQIP